MLIRTVEISDAVQIAEIYNYYIVNSTATFETEPVDAAEIGRRIGEVMDVGYPYLIAEDEGRITGYAYGHQFRARSAYRRTIEVSVYIKDGLGGRGIATLLYKELFGEIAKRDFHAVIAGISLPNDASVRLHERFGMKKAAHLEEVGFKFEKWIDTGYWQLLLNKQRFKC